MVMDKERRIIASHWAVPKTEVPTLVARLRVAHPDGDIVIDGQPCTEGQPASRVEALEERPNTPSSVASDGEGAAFHDVRLAHSMLWTTFDRAARVQAWMLQQANVFTSDLLENNRKLADQASEMQLRFQEAMQRLDLMETEQKLIEHDLMARRLSRHTIAQNRAEEEASHPPTPPDRGWIDELLSDVSTLIGGALRPPPKNWPKN